MKKIFCVVSLFQLLIISLLSPISVGCQNKNHVGVGRSVPLRPI